VLDSRNKSRLVHALVLMNALRAVQALALPVYNPDDPVPPDGRIKNSRDFKRLQSRAATVADLTTLAEYCQSRVSDYQQDKSKNEAEFERSNFKARTTNPKFQPLDKTLRGYIANDDKGIARWGDLANQYSAQTLELGVIERQQ